MHAIVKVVCVIFRGSQTNYVVCVFQISNGVFIELNTLAEVEGPGRVPLTDLTDADGYRVVGARTHVHATLGPSVIVTIQYKGEEAICFLPKRHALSLSPSEVIQLGSGDFKIQCLGMKKGQSKLSGPMVVA